MSGTRDEGESRVGEGWGGGTGWLSGGTHVGHAPRRQDRFDVSKLLAVLGQRQIPEGLDEGAQEHDRRLVSLQLAGTRQPQALAREVLLDVGGGRDSRLQTRGERSARSMGQS
eukprot:5859515-Prymnesium_polylepis.1